jgi:hypothetical protein
VGAQGVPDEETGPPMAMQHPWINADLEKRRIDMKMKMVITFSRHAALEEMQTIESLYASQN